MTVLRPGPPPDVGVWFSTTASTRLPAHEHRVTEVNIVLGGGLVYELSASEAGHAPGAEATDTEPTRSAKTDSTGVPSSTKPAAQTRRIPAGSWIWLPAGTSHRLVSMEPETALWVVETSSLPPRQGVVLEVLEEGYRSDISKVLRKLWLRPGDAARAELLSELRRLFDEPRLNDNTANANEVLTPELHPGVLRAKRACEALGNDELDVPGIAKKAGVSASRLAHLFQDEVGLSPLQYRNYCRVQHFIQSYREGEHNLTRGALRAGFGSYPQFHRVFRQVCGVSPRDHLDWLTSADDIDRRQTSGDGARD